MESSKPTSIWQGTTPQLAFIFGVIAGIAVTVLVIMVIGTPIKRTTTSASGTPTVTNTNTTADSGSQTYGDVKAVSDSDYIRGATNPKVTLVEYSDYECPYCKSFQPTLQRIMQDYSNDVAWVYRQFPLSFHANAQKESEAGLCVGKLGGNDAFWKFSDTIFERTTSNGYGFSLDNLGPLAKEVGVDQAKFQSCLDGGDMTSQVAADTADGTGAGASGTPTTFIVDQNGKTLSVIPGALPYDQVKAQLDQALASI